MAPSTLRTGVHKRESSSKHNENQRCDPEQADDCIERNVIKRPQTSPILYHSAKGEGDHREHGRSLELLECERGIVLYICECDSALQRKMPTVR